MSVVPHDFSSSPPPRVHFPSRLGAPHATRATLIYTQRLTAGSTRNANRRVRDLVGFSRPTEALLRPLPFMEQDETHLDPLSTLSIPRETTNWPVSPCTVEDKFEKRKSLRVRPSQLLENAEPPSPLNLSFKSAPPQSAPKMSLFNIFSRPKVERQRGYAERGVDITPTFSSKNAASSTPNLVVQVQPPDAAGRGPSAMSARVNTSKSASKLKFQEPAAAPRELKRGPFEPPPLFRAYPQSTKDGTLELSNLSAEAIMQKTKNRKGVALQVPSADGEGTTEDMRSFDTKKSAKTTLRHVANGSSVNVELPRKIFVLVTSGYILQYAESGPSNRLPERMLHLGKDSAAFACDLLPGKHYVLQVSEAVDQKGVIIANSGSIFSKLGIRSAAAKRMTSNFLLVMPSAREMESWMTAIRQEIESLGGKKIRPDPVRPRTGDPATKNDLKKTPSQSHRYQIKRNPSKVSNVTSPTQAAFPIPPSPSPRIEPDKDDTDTATIDGIEIEASKLDEDGPEAPARNRAESDAPSISSSAAASVEQHQLNNVRASVSYSNRTSHTSQAPTVATTVGTSRTNSLVGSPPSPQLLTGNMETARETPPPLKPTYRAMASYGVNRRRSAVPLPTPREGQTLPAINTSPAKPRHSVIVESPIAGSSPPLSVAKSPPKRLTATQSEPDLKGSLSIKERHDSKTPTPPPMPATEGERPESFVGDLPSPSTWSSSRPPNRRTSVIQTPATQTPRSQTPTSPPPATPNARSQSESTRNPELYRNKRVSFSMPLKVNPSGPHAQASLANTRRMSQMHDPDSAGDSPIVHTLTAKVDGSKRVSISQVQSNRSSMIQGGMQRSPSHSPSARLSLFPSQLSPPGGSPPEPPKRSSSAAAPTSYIQAQSQPQPQPQPQVQTQANDRTLKRPASLQVRSDPAPFLASVRNSTGPLDGRAVPIRGMKPSRSASNVVAMAQPSPTNAFKGLKFNTPTMPEEDDRATPLPDRAVSPLPSRPGSRSSARRMVKTRSSLPQLDLGIPVVGLGPPAPPPSAPLPLLPPNSRSTSPTPMEAANPGIDSVAGLGIRVS